MKHLIILLTLVFCPPLYALETVDNLEIERYMGLWHQIGAIPQSFAKDCTRNTTARYTLLENAEVEVINSCEKENGDQNVAEGRARVNPEYKDNAKLEVTFVNVLSAWIWNFSGDYWVIDLDSDYQWALVGHPERSGLYILSRSPLLENNILKQMRLTSEAMGYDSCDVKMTPTPGGSFNGTERFCDLEF